MLRRMARHEPTTRGQCAHLAIHLTAAHHRIRPHPLHGIISISMGRSSETRNNRIEIELLFVGVVALHLMKIPSTTSTSTRRTGTSIRIVESDRGAKIRRPLHHGRNIRDLQRRHQAANDLRGPRHPGIRQRQLVQTAQTRGQLRVVLRCDACTACGSAAVAAAVLRVARRRRRHVAHVDRARHVQRVAQQVGRPAQRVLPLVVLRDRGDAFRGRRAVLPGVRGAVVAGCGGVGACACGGRRTAGGREQVSAGDERPVQEDDQRVVDAVQVQDVGGWITVRRYG